MRKIISIVIAFLFIGFVTPASAFDFWVQTEDFSFAIGVPDNQGNQGGHYHQPMSQNQWPRNVQRRQRPQYNTPVAIPPYYELKYEVERSGRHCGRITYIQGEWYCRPQ